MRASLDTLNASHLIYAGAIPFWACALALATAAPDTALYALAEKALTLYALVIASFMAGAHWGQHLELGESWHGILRLSSNAMALAVWFGALLLSFAGFLMLCSVVFAALLLIDLMLYKNQILSKSYFTHRCAITAIVIAALLFAALVS